MKGLSSMFKDETINYYYAISLLPVIPDILAL